MTLRAKILLPLFLCLLGVSLLVGCIYLPIPEHMVNREQEDFRKFVGTDNKPAPIRVGVTRAHVTSLLGPTAYRSIDGRTMVYFVDLDSGYWIGIGCSTVDSRKVEALVLTFDENGVLARLRIEEQGGMISEHVLAEFAGFSDIHRYFIRKKVPEVP